MRRRFLVAPRARLDLLDIWEYVALDSPQRADGLLDRIKAAFERLATQPGMGVARDEIMAGLRSHPVWPYIVFYRLNPKARSIEIVRVLHGARDLSGEL